MAKVTIFNNRETNSDMSFVTTWEPILTFRNQSGRSDSD